MNYVGVDGCPKGWFAVSIDEHDQYEINIFDHIETLWQEYQKSVLILIDIPIGLSHWRRRLCDVEARKILGKRGSSVFPAPSREAIQQPNYENACKVNQKILGKKLSIQVWNICSKIKQVDDVMNRNEQARKLIRESHPEICFWALAGGSAMVHNKKTEPGFEERLTLLKNIIANTEQIVDEAMQKFKRKDVAKDDILDAFVLAITAASPSETIITVPENPEMDVKDLPMEMIYTNRLLK
jgi:predicted RNase H-like nuclease